MKNLFIGLGIFSDENKAILVDEVGNEVGNITMTPTLKIADTLIQRVNQHPLLVEENKRLYEALILAHKNLQGQEAFLTQAEWLEIESAINNSSFAK